MDTTNTTPCQCSSSVHCSCTVCNALASADELLWKEMAKVGSKQDGSCAQVTDVEHGSASNVKSVNNEVPSMRPGAIGEQEDEDPLAAAFFRDQARRVSQANPRKLLPLGEWAKIYKSAGINIPARTENSQLVGCKRVRNDRNIIEGENSISELASSLQKEFELALNANKI